MRRKATTRSPPPTRNIPELGIWGIGLNRRSGIRRDFLSRVAATSAVISIEPLPAESRCEEKGIFSVKRTHLTKELSHDIASATHDRGHAGEELLTAYPSLLRTTGLAVCAPFQ